jgi:hypothetical protein
MPEETPERWWIPVRDFGLHTIVGTLIFALISLPAIALNLFVTWLERFSISPIVTYGMEIAEYTIFGADLVLFVWFIVRTALKAGRRM